MRFKMAIQNDQAIYCLWCTVSDSIEIQLYLLMFVCKGICFIYLILQFLFHLDFLFFYMIFIILAIKYMVMQISTFMIQSFLCASWYSDFHCPSSPAYMWFSYSSMDSVFSRVVLLFLYSRWGFSVIGVSCLFINSYSLAIKYSSLASFLYKFTCVLLGLCLLVVERRREIHFYISIYNANRFIFVLGLYLKNIDFKFSRECRNCDCISFMQASEISQLEL